MSRVHESASAEAHDAAGTEAVVDVAAGAGEGEDAARGVATSGEGTVAAENGIEAAIGAEDGAVGVESTVAVIRADGGRTAAEALVNAGSEVAEAAVGR